MGEDAVPGGIRGGDQGSDQNTRRRLTVAQAADALGVTVDAVRARIKRKTIEHVRVDGRVYVILGGDQGDARRDQGSAQPETGPDYRDELIATLKEQLEAERNAHAETRRIAYTLAQRVPELESPREEPHGPETTPEATEGTTDTPTDREDRETGVQRRSWWRRFFGFE
jgi:excisionase family DNA binding protein